MQAIPASSGIVADLWPAFLVLLMPSLGHAQYFVDEILNSAGDGSGNPLGGSLGIAVDGSQNAFVAGNGSNNVFRVAPDGAVTAIIDSTGDGLGSSLQGPWFVAVDAAGNVYVPGHLSDNAFKIENPGQPSQTITEIIDAAGDLTSPFAGGHGIAVDGSGNVYVAGHISRNVFQITPGGVITEIIDVSGDGAGNILNFPTGVAVDGSGTVYVAAQLSDNAFMITDPGQPSQAITEIIDALGDGQGNPLDHAENIAVDGSGNVYVLGAVSKNVFKIENPGLPTQTITEIIDDLGDGQGNVLNNPFGIAVDGLENVYVSGANSQNVFQVTPGGQITQIADSTGAGPGMAIQTTRSVAVDGSQNVYLAAVFNAFKLCPGQAATEVTRLGSPPNPDALRPGATTGPVLGASWDPFIDHATFLPDAVLDFLGVTASATNVPLPPLGTLLCDLTAPPFLFTSAPGVPFSLSIPSNCILIGASLCSQGASASPTDVKFTNALDITIGTF